MATRQPAGGQYLMFTVDKSYDERSDMKLMDAENNIASAAHTLRKILQSNAQTSEEKFKVLDARDKLYKLMKDKESSLKRDALVATCPDMCPEKERLLRDYQGRGSMFEMTNFSKNSVFNHSLAVKEYARSSADQEEPLPHDLRPVHVLTMTMSHLLHNVVDYCELSDENLEEWYMFMWDRTRAIRKELTQQGVCNLESVTLVEQCARFHIHCAERLVDQDSSIYDDKINTENLTKCLQTLKYMYKDLAKEDIKCPNEPEFICYSLLLNLNNSSVFTELSGMSSYLMSTNQVKFALDVMATWETKNYIRFFNLVKKTTYLNCCLLRRYFGEMRLYAIKTMIRSYCTKNYSPQILISRFVDSLNFEKEEECLNFLSYCHFNFHEVDGNTYVNFDRVLFQNPNSTISSGRAFIFIEGKKQSPLSTIMAGGTLPPRLFEKYVPHNSFTPNGDLNPDTLLQKELSDFFSSSKMDENRPRATTMDFSQEKEQTEFTHESESQKREERTTFSNIPIFSFKNPAQPSSNIFGQTTASVPTGSSIFGKTFTNSSSGNIFSNSRDTTKSIFGNQAFSNPPSNVFGSQIFSSASQEKPQTEKSNSIFAGQFKPSNLFSSNFQNKPETSLEEGNLKKEMENKEREEREKQQREKEEEERRKRWEEEEAKLIMERKRLEEENKRKELEMAERKKKEEEERRKKEELLRLELEERNRKEEEARQKRLKEANEEYLRELKKREENERRIEREYKQKVDTKMSALKLKIQKWKTKIVFDKWRTKTWARIEERKMKEYFKEVKVKYPPVCTEEMLDGNPYGLVIPSTLTFEKFRELNKDAHERRPKKLFIKNNELPLLKIDAILGKPLKTLANSLKSNLDPFPWKLVISVPDESESPNSWKNLETFVEMHFVEHFQWRFGVERGPLYCREGNHEGFRFKVSIRRLRGSQLYEGDEPNNLATTGSNALIFFISEQGNKLTSERLKNILQSRSPLPKIPVLIIVLDARPDMDHLKKSLQIDTFEKTHISKYFMISLHDRKDKLIKQFAKCLQLAAVNSACPPSLRVNKFSSFISGSWFDTLWRRVEISLSNFKITLLEPKILIEFYNSCIDELSLIFSKITDSKETVLAEEFSECVVKPLKWTTGDLERLKSLLEKLKLPRWPVETPRTCRQLKYRIHQYCKKLMDKNKPKTKNLKWLVYRIIRQSLARKGLDIDSDNEIYEVLEKFPWIQVFQEITRVIIRQLCEDTNDIDKVLVVYNVEEIENFNFESSFISKFLRRTKGFLWQNTSQYLEEEKIDDLNPCLEKDSVVYAYSAAIERENNKRKREEYPEEGLETLFLSPESKRILQEDETNEFDISEMKSNFQSIGDRLDEMKRKMMENFKILTDIQSEMQ